MSSRAAITTRLPLLSGGRLGWGQPKMSSRNVRKDVVQLSFPCAAGDGWDGGKQRCHRETSARTSCNSPSPARRGTGGMGASKDVIAKRPQGRRATLLPLRGGGRVGWGQP